MTRLARLGRRLVLPAVILLAWQIGSRLIDPILLPSPAAALRELWGLAVTGDLWTELAVSLRRVALGFLIGIVIGIPLGTLLGSSRNAAEMFGGALPAASATSSAIWAVLGLLWFGLSDGATVFVIAVTAAPIIAVNTREGVRAVDQHLIELLRSMGFGPLAIVVKVALPSIVPYLFSGARLGLGFGWRVGMVAEALGSPSGAGFRLKQATDLLHTAEVFAWSLAVIGVMLLIEIVLFAPAEVRMLRWRKPAGNV